MLAAYHPPGTAANRPLHSYATAVPPPMHCRSIADDKQINELCQWPMGNKQLARLPKVRRSAQVHPCLLCFAYCLLVLPGSWQTDPRLLPHFSRFFPRSPVKSGRSPEQVLDMPWTMSKQFPKKFDHFSIFCRLPSAVCLFRKSFRFPFNRKQSKIIF